MGDSCDIVWCANAPQGWVHKSWDGSELILFSEETGNTHLLSRDGAEVAFELAKHPHGLTLSQLANCFVPADSPHDERQEVEAVLQAALLEFQRLGLAEPRIS
ncbi:MAG: hypothetical protein ACM3SV_13875 [Betaproteobacteria bacterium]